MSETLHDAIDRNLDRYREELFELLRIPSVSARREHDGDIRRAAEWVRERLVRSGLEAEIMETPGHPVVLGEWRGAGDDAPTVLVYGHYDVQPAEPLDLWTTPPFEPDVRDGRIYGRGSVDDKGQFLLHMQAIEAHLETNGRLPVNVIVLIEGEEEIGSPNLVPFIEAHSERLAADAVVISDTTMMAPGMPTITASLRGLVGFEIHVRGAERDLHSGAYGGAVLNPGTVLSRIIASFHDEEWRIAIPGFDDDVEVPEEYRERIAALPNHDEELREETGAPAVVGEAGYTTRERLWIRPTVEVNGLLSGYTGEGPKTVLPSKAMAKVTCRLAPGQDPKRIHRLFREHVARVAPEGVEVDVEIHQGGRAWVAELGGPLYEAAERALERAFGREPVFAGEGGSIPIVQEFERVLGATALLIGFGLPGENAHAPDEWMSVENFEKGIHAAAALLEEYGG